MEILSATKDDYLKFREVSKQTEFLGVHTPYTYWVVCNFFGDGCFIIKEDNEIVGSIFTVSNSKTLFIWQIAILKKFRGKGYSKLLYEAVLNYAQKNGKTELMLSIDPDNKISYNALVSFCKNHNLEFEKTGMVDICIPEENHKEYETIYRVKI